MYRLGLGLGLVWGLRLQISLIYEFAKKNYVNNMVGPSRSQSSWT